jgi:hypothetical protein
MGVESRTGQGLCFAVGWPRSLGRRNRGPGPSNSEFRHRFQAKPAPHFRRGLQGHERGGHRGRGVQVMRCTIALASAALVTLVLTALGWSQCKTKEVTPVATSARKRYTFEYRSGFGDDCRVYEVRNQPRGARTPVNWRDVNETFLQCQIPRAKAGVGDWIRRIGSSKEAEKGRTELEYGVNYDECSENPIAYREKAGAGQPRVPMTRLRKFVTILEGTLVDSEDKEYQINIQVTSSLERGRGKNLFTYTTEIGKGGKPLAVPASNSSSEGLRYEWKSPVGKRYQDALNRSGYTRVSTDRTLRFTVQGEKVIVSYDLLVIYRGKEKLAATTAPAYQVAGR